MPSPQIIDQGGAYGEIPRHMCTNVTDEEYQDIIKKSAKIGYDILTNGGTAVDAVEAAVIVLENCEYFNAGCGSVVNINGEIECDAMIMDGDKLKTGAVISGRHFLHPVSLAKLIMNKTNHCALSGDGARDFAKEMNFPIFEPRELITMLVERLKLINAESEEDIRKRYQKPPAPQSDTVSAVARDFHGNFACATSTGGIAHRLKGRVSDAPMVGCGGYANKQGAATTTGLGESLIRMTLARDVVFMMESGDNAQASAQKALRKMKVQLNGVGGVIAIDQQGNFGRACNTEMMGWASVKENTMHFGLKPDEVKEEQLV